MQAWSVADQVHPNWASQSSLVFLGHIHCPDKAGNKVAQCLAHPPRPEPPSAFVLEKRQLTTASSSTTAPPSKACPMRLFVDAVQLALVNKLANASIPSVLLSEIHKRKINEYQVLRELRKYCFFDKIVFTSRFNEIEFCVRTDILDIIGTILDSVVSNVNEKN